MSEAFSPFSGLNALHHNPYTEPLWRAAVTQYERGMAPAEQKIAGKLRQQLSDLSAKSHQVHVKFTIDSQTVNKPVLDSCPWFDDFTLLLLARVKHFFSSLPDT